MDDGSPLDGSSAGVDLRALRREQGPPKNPGNESDSGAGAGSGAGTAEAARRERKRKVEELSSAPGSPGSGDDGDLAAAVALSLASGSPARDGASGPPPTKRAVVRESPARAESLAPVSKKPVSESDFKAMCDMVWPSDRNVDKSLEIWHSQGFTLPSIARVATQPGKLSRNLRAAGLLQPKNGPCGVLAGVQAWMYRYYLFDRPKGGTATRAKPLSDGKDPTVAHKGVPFSPDAARALAMALGHVIWQSRSESKSSAPARVVVLKDASAQMSATYLSSLTSRRGRVPGYRENLVSIDCPSRAAVQSAIQNTLPQWMSPGGIVLLLYSLVMTRGVSAVRADLAASHTATLIANGNGYCNQELVNLVITGQATEGLHNSGNSALTPVYGPGVRGRQSVGFFPPRSNAKLLGSNLKCPEHPIWVVLARSHYSVVFLTDKAAADMHGDTPFAPAAADDAKAHGDAQQKPQAPAQKRSAVLWHYNGLESLRWRDLARDAAKDAKACRDYRGARLACVRLVPRRWAHLDAEAAREASGGAGGGASETKWACAVCTVLNHPSRSACGTCASPRPASAAAGLPFCVFASKLDDDGRYVFQVQPTDGKAAAAPTGSGAAPAAAWACTRCTFRNGAGTTRCSMCGQNRPEAAKPTWACPACTFRNAGGTARCSVCSAANPSDPMAPYQCVSCSVVNDPKVNPNKCGVCGKVRQRLDLCQWRRYDQLPASMRKEVYKFLPDLLQTLHILWRGVSLVYTGSSPTMTT